MTDTNSLTKKAGRRVLNIDCDCRILLITLVFVGVGVSLVASSSSFFAGKVFNNHFALINRHVIKVGIALVAMILAINIDYRIYRKVSPMFLLVGIGLLASLFIIPGSIRNADRWLYYERLQIALQPSEVARIALVFFRGGSCPRPSLFILWSAWWPPLPITVRRLPCWLSH